MLTGNGRSGRGELIVYRVLESRKVMTSRFLPIEGGRFEIQVQVWIKYFRELTTVHMRQ
jgi:hypothetical protein